MNFLRLFINWLKICITSAMFSVKINEALKGYFLGKSGLCQVDPLSPFLFVLAMEILTAYLKRSTTVGSFKHHWKIKDMDLTHLIFANDILLFSKGNVNSVSTLMNAIREFSEVLDLKVNPSKSSI